MKKLFLNVPYHQKDLVKNLGAKWDSIEKKWYAPPNVDLQNFNGWLPKKLQKAYSHLEQKKKFVRIGVKK